LNSYKISVKEWVAKTNAIGLVAKAGRYGGTYAHKDIAFEFGMWVSAEFKIYLIKEFQRLKDQELKQLGWDIRRNLTKINYRIHTDAIKQHLIPQELSKEQVNLVYASEADILNMALFGKTAKSGVMKILMIKATSVTLPMSPNWFVWPIWKTSTLILFRKGSLSPNGCKSSIGQLSSKWCCSSMIGVSKNRERNVANNREWIV